MSDNKSKKEKGRTQIMKLQPATASASGSSLKVLMRAYYSTYHLWAAKHFSDLSENAEIEEFEQGRFNRKLRAYVTNTILSAVSFLEAAINELYQDAADNHEAYIMGLDVNSKQLMADFWQATEGRNRSVFNILDKYQMALTILKKPKFNTAKLPYQDVALLIKLRNELVHFKPNLLGSEPSNEHNLTSKLFNKFPENKLMKDKGNPWFPDKCMGSGCAGWAVSSVFKFADEFYAKIDVEPNYKRLNWTSL